MNFVNSIISFRGPYSFLSNFYQCDIILFDGLYNSVEHAYQASKTLNVQERTDIRYASSPKKAKQLGKFVTLIDDWENKKIDIMRELITQKFSSKELSKKLIATGNAPIIEINWHGDKYWGVDMRGNGENNLGKLLMECRQKLIERL